MNSDQRRGRAQRGAVVQALQREGPEKGGALKSRASGGNTLRAGLVPKDRSGLSQRSAQYAKFPEHHHQFAPVHAHSGA